MSYFDTKLLVDTPTQIITDQYSKFLKFMMDYNVIAIGLGFIVADQLGILFKNLMDGIASPIITKLIGSEKKNLEEVKLTVFGMDLYIWKFLFSLFNFYLILVFLFYISKLLPFDPSKSSPL